MIASSVEQGPGHRQWIIKTIYFNGLLDNGHGGEGRGTGGFLPGGKIFPPKEPGLIAMDQGRP
ncbi:MAG: hypothetical protein ACJAVZ_000667 [Afipia broomeae]